MPVAQDAPAVEITGARVTQDGTEVAQIEAITVGGGTQVVTVDGTPEVRQHPTFHRFHVRLLSPDRMIPDVLREAETYEEAVEIATAYAGRRAVHAGKVAELAEALNDGGGG